MSLAERFFSAEYGAHTAAPFSWGCQNSLLLIAAIFFTICKGPILAHAASVPSDGPSAVSVPASPEPASACTRLWDFFTTSCAATRDGVAIYGTFDIGGTWQSQGTPFN